MIGFNALGRMGRLCNQMFQYAALKGLSSKIGAEICIPYYQQAVDDVFALRQMAHPDLTEQSKT